jgi:5-methylcytosine-specific restriction protein A
MSDEFYFLDSAHTDPKRVKRERERARELKQSGWWKQKVASGLCHYCEKKFKPELLTMDHIVPVARGGTSAKGNLVPACKECNAKKKLDTPVDALLKKLSSE